MATTEAQIRISKHAAKRWCERVDQEASPRQARAELSRFLLSARFRTVPRHWMRREYRPQPGLRFAYSAEYPGVCGIVVDTCLVTVVTRALLREHARGSSSAEHTRPMPLPCCDLARNRRRSRDAVAAVRLWEAA